MKKPLFSLGRVLSTPGAISALEEAGQSPWEFISAHAQGRWGELCQEDKELNDAAVVDGSRILSHYQTRLGVRLYVITEAVDDEGHRAATTILRVDEY